MRSTLLDGVNY